VEKRIEQNNPRWSIWEALLVFGLVLCIKVVVPFQQMSWFNQVSELISPHNVLLGRVFWSSIFTAALFFLLIGLIIKLKYRLSWSEVGLRTGRRKGWLTMGIGQGVLLFLLVTIVGAVISSFFPYKVEAQPIAEVFNTARSGWERILSFLIAAVAAPLSEELYFRGFLYPAVGKLTGKIPAVFLTSLFFSFLHFDLLRFIPITIGGIWLNMLYFKTESLYTPIIAHSVWNALMILMLFLAQSLELL
jgi:membrane protease YdiL (CAAX protease family)